MLVTSMVTVAAVLQLAAAVLVVRVLRITGRSAAWLLIAVVALLMAGRRCIVLHRCLAHSDLFSPDPFAEGVGLAISVLMLIGIARLGPFFISVVQSREALRDRTRAVQERMKKLNCLYGISRIVEQAELSLDEMLQQIVNAIPASWQYPDITCARVVLGDTTIATCNCRNAPWILSSPIQVEGVPVGRVDVGYLEARPACDEGPFQREERNLLNVIAERIGHIVERRRMQSECMTLQEQLTQAQKMEAVGQLAAGVAHDFNNLITLILAHTGQVRGQTGQTPEVAAALEVVENAARQATEVTRSLMTFASCMPARKQRVDLRDVLRDSVRMLTRTLPASIELAADFCEQPQWVLADPTQLHQVILNLALNARDAMPQGGRLIVGVGPASTADLRALPGGLNACADWARLLVCDTGVGIPPDLVPRLFEPFFTTKPRGQGTGLGLPVVHGIIREHRGHVRIQSEPGTGTEFCVLLPANVAPELKAPEPAPVTPARADGTLVLLAEDSTPLRRVMTSVLQNQGFRVVQAADGDAVLAALGQYGSDLRVLILDVDLPRLSGRACLRRIRSAGCHTPAILITAGPEGEMDEREDPDTRLLRKPFQMETLAGAACALLASGRRSEAEVPA